MSDTITTDRPKAKRRKPITPALRRRIEEAIDRMIDALDALDAPIEDREPENEGGDDELEGDDDPDAEPSLGAADTMNQQRAWSADQNPTRDDCEQQNEDGDELDTLECADLDINGESDSDNGGGTVDDEPSLGSLDGRMSQKRWGQPDRDVLWPGADFELDEAEQEGGIEDLPHDAEQDACPDHDGVPFMFGGDRDGDRVVIGPAAK